MEHSFLLYSLEETLGQSKKTSRDNYAFRCPFCHHKGKKLEIKLETNEKGENKWACWVCKKRGKTIKSLVKQLNLDSSVSSSILKHVKKGTESSTFYENSFLELPKEFIPLSNTASAISSIAKKYLYSRGITNTDIIRYNIGYATTGKYRDRIIIPSYNEKGNLNYFTARTFTNGFPSYLNPETSRDVVIFEDLINWNQPLVICEGMFDAIAIKRNVTPILGKNISKALYKKIYQSKLEDIYIALDKDALRTSVEYCEEFLNMGKRVFLVELEDKDPGKIGFINFTKLVQRSQELTLTGLVQYKLNLI